MINFWLIVSFMKCNMEKIFRSLTSGFLSSCAAFRVNEVSALVSLLLFLSILQEIVQKQPDDSVENQSVVSNFIASPNSTWNLKEVTSCSSSLISF